MSYNKKRVAFFLLILCLPVLIHAQKQPPFAKNIHRIVFLGNSITYGGTYISDIEAYFLTHYPQQQYEFINVGLPSETVSGLSEEGHAGGKFPRPDLHERLDRVLALTKPDLVFACYGMNDGIYQPLDEGRFAAFRNGIHWLHDKLVQAGVKRIIHLTPPVHDDATLGTKGYNLVLDAYSKWLLAQRDSLKWEVGDIHFPMTRYLEEQRQKDPSFKLANDGIHPGAPGHWLMAQQVLLYLGEKKVARSKSIEEALADNKPGKDVVSLVSFRQGITKDAWLTATGHTRPGMNTGISLPEAMALYENTGRAIAAKLHRTEKQAVIRIACIGASITEGARLKNKNRESYPAQLQKLLGKKYEVLNFGASSKTAMRTSDNSYMATDQYAAALASNPDIVTIDLGANDSRMPYRTAIADSFIANYKALIAAFSSRPSHPRIVLLLPLASYLTDTSKQTDKAITELIIPRIRQIAFDQKLELLDLHSSTLSSDSLFPDGLHPSPSGAAVIARRLKEMVTQKTVYGFDIFSAIKQQYKVSSFYGYDCADFEFEGRSAKIVKPRRVAVGKPWVWRARFWGHEPQTDIALLDRGYHIVYCDASELFGNAEAIQLWNRFYASLQTMGLAKKAAMEGMSRGGVYVYNWAAQNPDKIACVYADAPVLDMKSWPGGKGKGPGSAADWEKYKTDFGYTIEAEAMAGKNSPIDKIDAIAKGQYPMLHVVGDADEVVPVAENTAPFEKKIRAAGGTIRIIHKPGVGHHPHSLANPQPIVDFITAAVSKSKG